jgi:predicted metal-dependent HD superfamily phosphohydrolase
MSLVLQQLFSDTASMYNNDTTLTQKLWTELVERYAERQRHYHTLLHLENLYIELSAIKDLFLDWDSIVFALFYHDVVYKATANDNEEKSAILAMNRLRQLGVVENKIKKCEQAILATKAHSTSHDGDINFFTDADLSILGKPWAVYEAYFKNVRKEYSIYPGLIYNPGRRKVLRYFQQMERIFKTEHFHGLYEEQARENLAREISIL